MMQNLCLLGYRSVWSSNVGDIHCPDLHTLTMKSFEGAVESLISKPMSNVRHLRRSGYLVYQAFEHFAQSCLFEMDTEVRRNRRGAQ